MIMIILLSAIFSIGGYLWLISTDWRIAAGVFCVAVGLELQ